jgi:O-antigen/teichoic acid export membrane protein
MRINKNAAANYASRLWSGLSNFVFVPLYLRMLGPEAFGLVTFSASILGLVFIVDMGLSSAFAREMARGTDRRALGDLLRSLECVYLGIVLLVVLIVLPASGVITHHWLKVSHLSPGRVRVSVQLMMVSAVLQVMMSLYLGGLLGSSRHVAAAWYQVGFGFVRSGLVLVPLYFWPVVELVFGWQLVASVIFLLMMRRTIWRVIDTTSPPHFSRQVLANIHGFAGGMFAITLISAINTQSDKFVVSKIFTLDQLGLYALAGLLGQAPSMMALPLAVTVLPRLTSHVARGETGELLALYMRYSFMISAVAFTAAIAIFIGAGPLLAILKGGTPSPELVKVAKILAAGGAMLAAQYMPYHLAIASGHTRTSVVFGTISAILLPIAMFVGASRSGLVGAALPWLVMNSAVAILLAWRITPRFLGPHLFKWTWKANLVPLVASAVTIYPGTFVLQRVGNPLIFAAVLGLFSCGAIAVNGIALLFLGRPPFTKNVQAETSP